MLTEHDFSYCPKCGNQFGERRSNLLVCKKCDLHFYISPRPTSEIIFEDKKGRILLVKRKYPPKKGFYDLPGGFVDINETAEAALQREIREELGIKITEFTFLGTNLSRYVHKGVKYYTIALTFVGPLPEDQKITVSSDISGVQLFEKDKIPFDKLSFEGIKVALKNYLKNK